MPTRSLGRVALFLSLFVVAFIVGCSAAQLARVQQDTQTIQSLTTQPVVNAIAAAVPGGQEFVSIVGAIAGVVGAVAGHLATKPAVARSRTAAQKIAAVVKTVQAVVTDPAAKQAIDAHLSRLPADVQTLLAAASTANA